MSTTPDNPPAFPAPPGSLDSVGIEFDRGMTLRDYFAAKAMEGIFAYCSSAEASTGTQGEHAKWAYNMADAMLAEREKGASK